MDPDHFQSAKLKIRRAYHHITEIDQILKQFFLDRTFHSVSCKKVGDKYMLHVETGGDPLPENVPLILGDAVHNIRTAFDHVVVAFTKGKGDLALPVAKTAVDLTQSGKIFTKIKKDFPTFADYILNNLEPFKGGQLFLWEITQLDNLDKHNLLIPTLSFSRIDDIEATAEGGNVMKGLQIRMRRGMSMSPIALGVPITVTSQGKAFGTLLFGNDVLPDIMIVPTLTNCVHRCFEALNALELFCYGKVSKPDTLE